MQIASNTVGAVVNHFKKELWGMYTESELRNITYWVLQKQLGLSITEIISDPQRRIYESDLTPLARMCAELKNDRPVQYVLGEAEFYECRFRVNEAVLIPRPETEELVEHIIKEAQADGGPLRILDIGTGSGCIAVALKRHLSWARVCALDVSAAALDVAKLNARMNGTEVTFFEADVLAPDTADVIYGECPDKFDIIVSNPPYVLWSEQATLHARVRGYEPPGALFVNDPDPLLFYRRIAKLAEKLLRPGAVLWFECHSDYTDAVAQMLVERSYKNVSVLRDLSGLARFARATRA